eukprot:scaffold148155_cov17-Prasinocladus_malaysianus.AAC.1
MSQSTEALCREGHNVQTCNSRAETSKASGAKKLAAEGSGLRATYDDACTSEAAWGARLHCRHRPTGGGRWSSSPGSDHVGSTL